MNETDTANELKEAFERRYLRDDQKIIDLQEKRIKELTEMVERLYTITSHAFIFNSSTVEYQGAMRDFNQLKKDLGKC